MILNEEQKQKMREAGKFNAQLMDFIRKDVIEGVSTKHLDKLVHEYTLDHGHIPACLGYKGYPATICTSVNEVVCHGIPGEYTLKSGDIINIDLTTIVDSWYGDQSETFMIGEVSEEVEKLVRVTKECLYLGIKAVKPNGDIYDIGAAIQGYAHLNNFSVVREYCGHGLGQEFHQNPMIPHYYDPFNKAKIIPNTCFTIEPMINIGAWQTNLDENDGWTVRTVDSQLSAQFEHTLLINEDSVEVLTLVEGEVV